MRVEIKGDGLKIGQPERITQNKEGPYKEQYEGPIQKLTKCS